MKALIRITLIFVFILLSFACTYAQNDPYNLQVKQLYANPNGETAKIVYQIPIDVKLLDISEDANWYKVAIKFQLGPMQLNYSGWAYIPVGNILAEREAKNGVASVVKLPPSP